VYGIELVDNIDACLDWELHAKSFRGELIGKIEGGT